MTTERDEIGPVEAVRVARKLMLAARTPDALDVLERVRLEARDYASFYIVLGECLIASGYLNDAVRALRHALHISPNSARPAILLEAIQERRTRAEAESPHKPAKSEPTLAGLFEPVASNRAQPQQARSDAESSTNRSEIGENFDLAHVAMLLTRDRPLVRPQRDAHAEDALHHDRDDHEPSLSSETLAGILLGQGKFDEALRVYRLLRDREPNRRKYYDERIRLIEDRLKSIPASSR